MYRYVPVRTKNNYYFLPADRWWSTGHAQIASTAIMAAPRQMATIFIFTRAHDMGFTPHRASETVNS